MASLKFEFCIWGPFVRHIWILFKSRSHDLHRGQTCFGLQMWCDQGHITLTSTKKPNVQCKRSSRARFQVICFIRELVTAPNGQLIWGQFTPYPSSNICIRLHFFFVRETVNLWDGLRDETFCLFCFCA